MVSRDFGLILTKKEDKVRILVIYLLLLLFFQKKNYFVFSNRRNRVSGGDYIR